MDENLEETTNEVIETKLLRRTLAHTAKVTLVAGGLMALGAFVGARLTQSNDNE